MQKIIIALALCFMLGNNLIYLFDITIKQIVWWHKKVYNYFSAIDAKAFDVSHFAGKAISPKACSSAGLQV